MLEDILTNIETRKKILAKIKDQTDLQIQSLKQEMQNDHQNVFFLEINAEEQKRKQIKQIRKQIEDQQQLVHQYETIRYRGIVKKSAPKTPVLKNAIAAFLIGGLICSIGQIFLNYFINNQGLAIKEASTVTAMVMVFLGAFLTGLGIYDEIGKIGGAGSMVPITGFANSIVSPALEFKREGFVYGVGAKVFTIAGPVLLYGALVSVIIGLITYITL